MNVLNLIISAELLCFLVEIRSQSLNETLVLVHTIFRHGDRNPDLLNLYSSNPYYDESNYAPFGYGQLTNAMLAGLFPPTKDLMWLEGLNWQPISFNYVERQYDKELFCYGCPNWDTNLDAYLKSADGQDFTNKYEETFKYISENTGENITDIIQVYYMYFGFLIQEELNFTLPEWTKAVYPYPMRNITTDYYALMFSTKNLKIMSAGYLLKKIIIDTQNRINGSFPQRKMYIYCAHENNIASVLKIFNLWNDEEIAVYGSYILIELHYINGTYGIKV
ncbi:hypothetical protein NQ314_015923 [Rhamnusium bicolor]|uniref:acid phosphatase n=1 Tax=Rhamnusium bicolor TaxID=1586634 RepID=A0AAV8WY86_9CUCU|nr:hypothetical protein NQ314_015923 [Rhamnusium bicolor]